MKILFHHLGVLPVTGYGGIERILFWHMKELVRQGQQVVLIGHPRSKVSEHGIDHIHVSEGTTLELKNLVPRDSDIIHLQYNHVPELAIPSVVTMHGNGNPGEVFPLNTVFLSQNHAKNHAADCYIHNGIDLDEFPFTPQKKHRWEEFLFMAKGSWRVKNLKQCINAVKEAKKFLHIAGGRNYWPSRHIKSYGTVGREKKLRLLRQADALLFPVRWPEPFGLAVVEAMSQGLPVIASPFGALPEIVNNECGVLCNNYAELVESLLSPPHRFDPETIRNTVEQKFTIEITTQNYLKVYARVISGEMLNQMRPTYQNSRRAQDLLPF